MKRWVRIMSESMANQAYATQGPQRDKNGKVIMTYAGHDRFQNGVLSRDNPKIYMAGWAEDWGATSGASGYFTDQATIDSCIHNGVLDTNELDGKLQTALSDYNPGVLQAHSHVSAYDVDFDKLDQLEKDNPELYNKLTAPDGKQSGEIKVAYGEAKANIQHGPGGGHQYYINPDTFREALKEGVFKYNPNESFSVNKAGGEKLIDRTDIPESDYSNMMKKNKNKATDVYKEIDNRLKKELKEKSIDVKEQNNQYEIKTKTDSYIAEPDMTYNYSVDNSNKEKAKSTSVIKKAETNTKQKTRAKAR